MSLSARIRTAWRSDSSRRVRAALWREVSFDNLWHLLAGFACVVVFDTLGIAVAAVIGFGREWWQHRDDDPIFTFHRYAEALAWPAGAVVGVMW